VRRGFGASGRLTVAAGYRVADLASDLVAVMEAAGFERFSVFGYSFTGAAAEADPAAWADLNSRFDNRAALAFYRELSELPPDFLVGNLPCPLFAFWGEEDEEIARGGGVRLLAAGLDRRGLKHAFFPGHDHEGMLAHINEAVPSVLAWFDGLPRAE
jgi:pimeloyl-ACP methyl ester carboxylesterase